MRQVSVPLLVGFVAVSSTLGLPLDSVDLTTAAAASSRPAECGGGSAAVRLFSPWDRARRPGLHAFCLTVARGYAALRRSPEEALRLAVLAEEQVPQRSAAVALRARALVRLGRYADAWPFFERATARDPHALDAPAALHDYALSAVATAHSEDSLRAYRALVPRIGLVFDPLRRERIYVEAAVQVMGLGPQGLDEAVGYLEEARRRGTSPAYRDLVLGCLALALDRQGNTGEAVGVASEASGPWALEALTEEDEETEEVGRRQRVTIPLAELHAIVAILAEGRDAESARSHWRDHAELTTAGPFADYARRKARR